MTTHVVNTHEAKSRLSELIRAAEQGTEVIVARNGQPVARIVAWTGSKPTRSPGAWHGLVTHGDDVVVADSDVADLFEESADAGLL